MSEPQVEQSEPQGQITRDIDVRPRIWMNKINAEVVVVTPWLVPVGDYIDLKMKTDKEGIPFVWGSFYQCGWLVENGHNVFFGFPMSVEDQFEDLGLLSDRIRDEESE